MVANQDEVWEKLKEWTYATALSLEYLNGKLEEAEGESHFVYGPVPHNGLFDSFIPSLVGYNLSWKLPSDSRCTMHQHCV